MRGGSVRETQQRADERSGGIVLRVPDVSLCAQVRRAEFRVDDLRNPRFEQFKHNAQCQHDLERSPGSRRSRDAT